MRSIAIRTVAMLVIVGSLAASPRGIQLAWGVLYPRVEGADSEQTFDAIVVLSGEDRRVVRGIELAEAGKASVLVAINGEVWEETRSKCGSWLTYETRCPVPKKDSTLGEVQLIRDMAEENRWRSLLVVTGDYHASRARLLFKQCLDKSVSVSFDVVDWNNLTAKVMRREVLKGFLTSLFYRVC